jgi:hypothetical protein
MRQRRAVMKSLTSPCGRDVLTADYALFINHGFVYDEARTSGHVRASGAAFRIAGKPLTEGRRL